MCASLIHIVCFHLENKFIRHKFVDYPKVTNELTNTDQSFLENKILDAAKYYKHISITSAAGKVLERLVNSAATKHIDSNELLIPNYHGIRQRKSTETNLLIADECVIELIDKRVDVDDVLLDFSVAFAKVCHKSLKIKLPAIGIDSIATSQIMVFLTSRKQPFILVSQKLRCTNFGLVVKHMLTKVEKCENLLHVSWKDSTKRTYPLVWLRDNCQCEKCFHPESKSRTLLLKEFDTHPAVLNGTLSVAWSDGHKSAFNSDWLLLRGFDNESQRKRSEQVCSQKILWNSGLKENLPRSNFFSAINENESLVCWLKSLQKYGVAILENAPCKQGQVRILAHKIGFIKKTHYGEEFQVQAKDQPNNVAYTSTELQLHTDLPYYEYKPG
ncbi:hypothetical protein QYM36_001366, partial [Artemia franciscana]